MVGSALIRELNRRYYKNIIIANRQELDLENQKSVQDFLRKEKPGSLCGCC